MEYEIKLSQNSLKIINDALMQMPYYLAAKVIKEINEQLKINEKLIPEE